jgi:phosphodiesterase/alkaline phosphatase D-like protein
MKTYEAMRRTQPDFFIHSGDNIYADGPLLPEVKNAAGEVIWRNSYLDVVPEKLKVAETLHEFRRNYLYNRYDEHVRAFSAEVPQIWQWDDHEIVNNWSPSKQLDARYATTNINVLVANGRRAFLEYSPLGRAPRDELGRVYRDIPYGEDLDIFVLDMRTYRAGNGCNVEPAPGPETAFLGRAQIEWLKRKLRASRATWKVIAADMPLGLIVGDGSARTRTVEPATQRRSSILRSGGHRPPQQSPARCAEGQQRPRNFRARAHARHAVVTAHPRTSLRSTRTHCALRGTTRERPRLTLAQAVIRDGAGTARCRRPSS